MAMKLAITSVLFLAVLAYLGFKLRAALKDQRAHAAADPATPEE
jgi:hypothetical protein